MNLTAPSPVAITELLDIVETALATLLRRLPPYVARDDLSSVGKIALIKAASECGGTLDELRAYCFVRVRGAMLDELRRLDPVTRRERNQLKLVAQGIAALCSSLGRLPTVTELAAATGLSRREVIVVQAAIAASEDYEPFDWDGVASEVPSPAEEIEVRDLQSALYLALSRLPAKYALILRRYYLEDATLEDIALELCVSKERVRQLREVGENKLRADFALLAGWQTLLDES